MTETRIGGRPRGKQMPCGWQCGAVLTASEMRGHFTTCPRRPGAVRAAPDIPHAQRGLVRPVPAGQVGAEAIPATMGSPPITERVAGLKTLLRDTEERVGMGETSSAPETPALTTGSMQAWPRSLWPSAPISQGEHRHESPSPYQQSENRRAWAMKFSKLKALGQYDPGGAAEEFAELVKGHQLPKGFMQWTDPRKMEWLLENVTLPD